MPANRTTENHFNPDGSYTVYWSDGFGDIVSATFPAGDPTGAVYAEMDHRQMLDDEYYEKAKDPVAEIKKKAATDPNNSYEGDPIAEIADKKNPFDQNAEPDKPLVILIRELMAYLTPEQRDLIFDVFGADIQQTEIAERDGVSKQAVNNRLNKIIARLRKLCEERGITEYPF